MKNYLKYLWLIPCVSVMMMGTASAYIDPSVMTYGIQIVAGIVVAVGVAVSVAWRRAKRKVQDKLGIDENSKKEVEDDIEEINGK